MRLLAVCIALLAASAALAIDDGIAFDDPAMQARYEHLIDEVRCVMCQNQTIRDSNAFVAADLRREIRQLMTEGKTDDEIRDFLVARYGEFILYRPRRPFLWIVLGLMLIVGLFAAVRVVRTRAALPIDTDEA